MLVAFALLGTGNCMLVNRCGALLLSSAVLGMLLNRRVVAHCVFATEACMIGGTFSSALLGSLLDDAIGVSAALSFPVVLAAIACLLMGLLAGSMHGWAF